MTRKIYLATSWKNNYYPVVLDSLRDDGHEVYDFRENGFSWQEVDPNWKNKFTDHEVYFRALHNPRAQEGFNRDLSALHWADTCVLLTPSGRSAHLEAGFMCGQGKEVYILLTETQEWDLMYLLSDKILTTLSDLKEALR